MNKKKVKYYELKWLKMKFNFLENYVILIILL